MYKKRKVKRTTGSLALVRAGNFISVFEDYLGDAGAYGVETDPSPTILLHFLTKVSSL